MTGSAGGDGNANAPGWAEPWMLDLPPEVRGPVLAYADPRPPGARARAGYAATAVVERARTWPRGKPGLRPAIQDLISHLHAVGQTTIHQPGIGNTLAFVLAEGVPEDPARAARLLGRRAALAAQTMTEASATMAQLGAGLLEDGDTILVHDFADRSTQAVVTRAAHDGKHLSVIATACRSRRTDGIRVARESIVVGHSATVVTDAGIGWIVSRGGLRACFIGADSVMPDGTVMTTPGALAIALVGQRYAVPVYAVTDLWKIMASIPRELHELNEKPDPDGVPEALEWEAAGFRYFNPLVDFVPGDTLAAIICEAGIIPPATAGETANRLYGLGLRAT